MTNAKGFSADVQRISDQNILITLNGWIVENCELPDVSIDSPKCLVQIDCQNLMGINSIGIRSWMMWLKGLNLKNVDHFDFSLVHPSILQQSALVSGFLPPNAVVSSFYVHYWCEELQEEKEFLIKSGRDYDTTKMTLQKIKKETRGGKTILFEIDTTPKKIASFYKGIVEIL